MGMESLLTAGASATLPGNDPGISGRGSLTGGDMLTQLLQLQKMQGTAGVGANTPLTTMGAQPITPTMRDAPQVGTPQIPQGSFHTKGEAKRANKQQIFSSIANITKMGVKVVHDKQVQTMQKNTERLLGAMEGLKEAQAAGDQDAIKHNTELINMMLDPTTPEGKKRIKAFQKAFSVNLMDDKNKDTPEYKGLQAAYKQYGQDKASGKTALNPIAQRFQASMPQRAQMNPELAARAQAIQAGLIPDANKQMDAQIKNQENAIELQRIQGILQKDQNDIASHEKIAQMLANAKDNASIASIKKVMMQTMGAKQRAQIMASAMNYRTNMHFTEMISNPKWSILRKQLDAKENDANVKGIKTSFDIVSKQIDQLQKASAQAFKEKDTTRMGELEKSIVQLRGVQEKLTNSYEQQIGPLKEEANTPVDEIDPAIENELMNLFTETEKGNDDGGGA